MMRPRWRISPLVQLRSTIFLEWEAIIKIFDSESRRCRRSSACSLNAPSPKAATWRATLRPSTPSSTCHNNVCGGSSLCAPVDGYGWRLSPLSAVPLETLYAQCNDALTGLPQNPEIWSDSATRPHGRRVPTATNHCESARSSALLPWWTI